MDPKSLVHEIILHFYKSRPIKSKSHKVFGITEALQIRYPSSTIGKRLSDTKRQKYTMDPGIFFLMKTNK